jgi:tetratricopeptide (TPR) repeat protein
MKSNLTWLPLSLLLSACAHQAPGLTPEVPADAVAASAAVGQEEDTPRLQPTSPDLMYRVFAGEVLGAEGDMERAASEYLEAAMESEDPEIAGRATRIALAAQAWQHAAMAADRWVLLQPENIDARQTAARTMIVVGDYVGAEHHLNGIIRQMPQASEQAWALVASLLAASGNPEKSMQILNQLVEENGAELNPDAMIAKSRFLAARGELDEAMDLALLVLEQDPDRAEFHAWAGRIAVNLEQEQLALDHYTTAWTLQPGSQGIAMAYAELLARNGETTRAQEVLAALEDMPSIRLARIAFALDSGMRELAEQIYSEFPDVDYPDPVEQAFQAAQAAELLGWPAEAAEWYAKVVSGERKLVAALRRAYLTAEAGDLAAARNQLSRLRMQHDSAIVIESFMAESEILVSANQPEEAFELLTGALEMNPAHSQLLYGRAMIAVQLDLLAEAEGDLRQVIDLEPQNAAALNALGYTLADRMDRYDEAERLIHAAFALQPEEASIIDSMGWVAFRLGRLAEAERFLRDAWSRDTNAEIAAHLGEVLWVSERREEALSVWKGALESDPSNAILIDTMQRYGVEP